MSENDESSLAKVLHDSFGGSSGSDPAYELIGRIDERLRGLRQKMLDFCSSKKAQGRIKPSDFDDVFEKMEKFRHGDSVSWKKAKPIFGEILDAIHTANRNLDWSIRKEQDDKRLQESFDERLKTARQREDSILTLPHAGNLVNKDDFKACFDDIEDLRKDGILEGDYIEQTFAALDRALDEAALKVTRKQAALEKLLQDRQAFDERFSRLEKRIKGAVETPGAEGVVEEKFFGKETETLKLMRGGDELSGGAVDKAFAALEERIEQAEEKVAEVLAKLEQERLAIKSFVLKANSADDRAAQLVMGALCKAEVFEPCRSALRKFAEKDEVPGEEAAKALQALESLIEQEEQRIAKQKEMVELLAVKLGSLKVMLKDLKQNQSVEEDTWDEIDSLRAEAERLILEANYEVARATLKTASRKAEAVKKLADERQDIVENLSARVSELAKGPWGEIKLSSDSLLNDMSEDQLVVLIGKFARWQKEQGSLARKRLGGNLRDEYQKFDIANKEAKKQEKAEEETEEEPEQKPVQESWPQRAERLDKVKKSTKSILTLLTLEKENEIFSISRAFANYTNSGFKAGNTGKKGDYVKDFCVGYHIRIKNGPLKDDQKKLKQYGRMYLHVHYDTDKEERINMMHFKDGDYTKNHWMVKSQYWPTALGICSKFGA